MVTGFSPSLNVPTRKKMNLVSLFTGNAGGGIKAPYYYTDAVVVSGSPMKFTAVQDEIALCVKGSTHGAKCCGLAMQDTYSEANWDSQLKAYHFANDTRQRTDGQPIGLLTGSGFAATLNYTGTVAYGDQAYVGASGLLEGGGAAGDALPCYFEGAGINGATAVRLRFSFPLNVGV